MSDSNFYRVQSKERETKIVHAEVAIGASGAPTITSAKGVASIVRNSAGDYTVTLSERYSRVLSMSVLLKAAAAEDLTSQLVSETVASTKTINFLTLAAAVATDPSNGASLFIRLELKNSDI